MRIAAFAVCLLPSLVLTAQEKATLRYAFKPGQVFWTETVQDINQNMSMMGRDQKTAMSMHLWTENKVTEVKDGIATLEQRCARMTVKSDGPGMKVDYDSDVEGSSPGIMRKAVAIVGKSMTARIDATGKLVEFKAADDVAADMEQSGVNLKQSIEQSVMTWPKDPVGVGDTWQTTLDMPMAQMGSMKATITNKLTAMKDGMATVEQTMVMDTTGIKMPGGMKMEVPKAGGASKVALDCCLPVEGATDLQMVMVAEKESPVNVTIGIHTATKQVPAPAPKKPAEAPKKPADAPKEPGKQ